MKTAESAPSSGAEQRGFFVLLRDLADSSVDLVHNAIRMAASEGRVVLHRIVVRLGLAIAGLFAAAAGLVMFLAGIALLLVRIAGVEPWIACLLTGGVTLAAGAAFAVRSVRRLSDPDLGFQATLAELHDDVHVLRGSFGAAGNRVP